MKKISLLMASLLIASLLYSKVTICGKAYLESSTHIDSILILFQQITPAVTIDSVYTDSSGNFSVLLDIGVYDITYKKEGYYILKIKGKELFANTSLIDTTLIKRKKYLYVPDDFHTIQSAIETAEQYDTVIVTAGTYYEKINFLGKSIVVASKYLFSKDTNDIKSTIIDGKNSGRVVEIISKGQYASLIGFTITHGYNPYNNTTYGQGGGIIVNFGTSCGAGSIILDGLIIKDNLSCNGAGIYIYGVSVSVRNTIIKNNTSNCAGGGLFYEMSTTPPIGLVLDNVKIINNKSAIAGGILNSRAGKIKIINSIIAFNSAITRGGGIEQNAGSSCDIYNSNISNNSPDGIIVFLGTINIYNSIISGHKSNYGIRKGESVDSVNINIYYSNFWDNYSNCLSCKKYFEKLVTTNSNGDSCDLYHNIFMDPLLDVKNDFKLTALSPCIDAGSNEYLSVQHDLIKRKRLLDGNSDGDSIVDIGTYEFGSSNSNIKQDLVHNQIGTIYPNPNSGKFTIYCKNAITAIEIYKLTGDLIYSKFKLNQLISNTIDISNYPKGIYFVKINSREKVSIKKIIIQ